MNNTESTAVFAINLEHNEVLNDLAYAKRRLDRMLAIINDESVPEAGKYKVIAEMVWETADYLDDWSIS